MSNKKLFSQIIDDVMAGTGHLGEAEIKRKINSILRAECLSDSYECIVRTDQSHPWKNKIEVGIAPRSAVDQLADVGERARTEAAYERGLRDGERLKSGEVSADELLEELSADPP